MGIWIKCQNGLRVEINGYHACKEADKKYSVIGFDTRTDDENNYFVLGVYNTGKRAEEVLKMLDNQVIKMLSRNIGYLDAIFEMPQESEVE